MDSKMGLFLSTAIGLGGSFMTPFNTTNLNTKYYRDNKYNDFEVNDKFIDGQKKTISKAEEKRERIKKRNIKNNNKNKGE
jgi:uncharacterized membrane protein